MSGVRGWCPDLFRPMLSGDGWLIRVRPGLARLKAGQAAALADMAAAGGNRVIELTSRGNLQLRGFTPATAEAAARQVLAEGLADRDPARESRRCITAAPLMPAAGLAVAEALDAALAQAEWLDPLPAKFAAAVSAGPFPLAGNQADLMLREQPGGWRLTLGDAAIAATASDVPATAMRMLREALAAGTLRHRRTGWRAAPPPVIGWHAPIGTLGFGLPFGQLDADLLRRLATLAGRHGDGLLHLTPWRAMLLAGLREADLPALRRELHGLVLEAGDPRLLVSACIGSAGCSSGLVDARSDALALLRLGVRAASIHVSGCAKGCAHPGPAAVTLVGGRSGRYGLVRDGRAGDTALAEGLDCVQLALRLA